MKPSIPDSSQAVQTLDGSPIPLGPCVLENGIQFSIVAPEAKSVKLKLLSANDLDLLGCIPLCPERNRTGEVWHIFIPNAPLPLLYSYIINTGNGDEELLDPMAPQWWSAGKWNNRDYKPYGFLEQDAFDWEHDRSPGYQASDLIIYEMHIRGLTQDPSSAVQHPGSYLGVIEKIPYLKRLGINAIELLPVFEFFEGAYEGKHPNTGETLCNYWGYSPLSFFAPMSRYASAESRLSPRDQFREMVKALHHEGIEVILDVVYNHTGEGGKRGSYSLLGLAPKAYYMWDETGEHRNYTGCGNTLSANHPVTRELIRSSLRYWVTEMHVDGFRFDLAAALTRSPLGVPMEHPPLLESISEDPILKGVKLIAEPWDTGGLYQVGGFYHGSDRWSEWNGQYRDTVRRFLRGAPGQAGAFAQRISGSEDLYGPQRSPAHSLNFVTAHDGFSLRDLVSYSHKHNLANGEQNRDGHNENESWNCGHEGPSPNPEVETLRQRQGRNFLLALFCSQGIPMLTMGDEYGHSKAGNNNAWCQDNPINWFQWDQLKRNKAWWRFCAGLIQFRHQHSVLRRTTFLKEEDITWHNSQPQRPDWSHGSRLVAFSLHTSDHSDLYLAFNAADHETLLHLPKAPGDKGWARIADSSLVPPNDFCSEGVPLTDQSTYSLPAHSSLMLRAQACDQGATQYE